jgi:hypothetical protein
MKKVVLGMFLAVATLAFAESIMCPWHTLSSCYPTGNVRYTSTMIYTEYKCSCGDSVWVPR